MRNAQSNWTNQISFYGLVPSLPRKSIAHSQELSLNSWSSSPFSSTILRYSWVGMQSSPLRQEKLRPLQRSIAAWTAPAGPGIRRVEVADGSNCERVFWDWDFIVWEGNWGLDWECWSWEAGGESGGGDGEEVLIWLDLWGDLWWWRRLQGRREGRSESSISSASHASIFEFSVWWAREWLRARGGYFTFIMVGFPSRPEPHHCPTLKL